MCRPTHTVCDSAHVCIFKSVCLFTLCLFIATATNSNWLAYRLLMLLLVLNMFTSHCGFFHYSPKRAESLKEVQKVLDLPELKLSSHQTHAGSPMRGVYKLQKRRAIVACLDHIYTDSHEPKALGLKKILCKKSTVAAIYLVLPQLTKLSRALQTESLDLSRL